MSLTPLRSTAMPAAGDLRALVDDVRNRIARALDGTWPPRALPTLATIAADGPRARVLALRTADAATGTFVFHADARSDKIRDGVLAPHARWPPRRRLWSGSTPDGAETPSPDAGIE